MGRRSTRENKSPYQVAREKCGLTLEDAAEQLGGISADRLAKLESGATRVQPEDVLLMAECYREPVLCNYYCTHECAIGQRKVAEITPKPFSQIAVETLNAVNRMNRQKDRLLEIVEDGTVDGGEIEDFADIKQTLEKIAAAVSSLQLWVDEQIAGGKLDAEKLRNAISPKSHE